MKYLLFLIVFPVMACEGPHIDFTHSSNILEKDYGDTTLGIGYTKRVGRFEFTGNLSTPVLKNDEHIKGNWEFPIGTFNVRIW